ncbi:Sensor histidine kinase YehU [compost metagenome]
MLDKFKSDSRRDPVYYRKDVGIIYNRTANRSLTQELMNSLKDQHLEDVENRTVKLRGEDYMVNIVSSATTGWYLVDYMPLKDIIAPIEKSNRLFYFAVGSLLLMSCLAAYMLYAQVQVPVRKLVLAFSKLKNGDYSVRLEVKGKNEFSFVFKRFNLMVAQIQELFENVYMERIHVREARLKQLQSQINPHFFYNCFSFISSMAKLQNMQAVVAMSQNLSSYYRYTTRQERDVVPLEEELGFVRNYLEIQKMRKPKLEFSIDIPLRMLKWEVPLLVVQPLVENALLHGIRKTKRKEGTIHISARLDHGDVVLIVADDGVGMEQEQAKRLLLEPSSELRTDGLDSSFGLYNVNERIRYFAGNRYGLSIAAELGKGTTVTVRIKAVSAE